MLHPVLITWGVFDEEVRPWEGTLGATFSDEFLDMGEGYGIKYEHAATPPSILAIFAPWRGSRESAELMQSLRYTAGYGALQRARDGGEVVVGGDGLPTPRWALSDFDRDVMRRGSTGRRRSSRPAARGASTRRTPAGSRTSRGATAAARACSRRRTAAAGTPAQVTLGSFHLMGTARMGSSREDSVCDSDGEAWDVKGLYVVDGAVLPTGLGVNPMVTIEAAAHKIARGMAARLGGCVSPPWGPAPPRSPARRLMSLAALAPVRSPSRLPPLQSAAG